MKGRLMTNRVLITGAGGFIGNAVLDKLRDTNASIRALDLGPSPVGLPDNVEWIQGNINDETVLQRAVAGVDRIIHLAFLMDIEAAQPLASAQTNLLATIRLFDLALERKISRVIWASSVMVYGPRRNYPSAPITEDLEPMPRTPYGASKLALEWFARSYRSRGLETVGLRFTTVFGPKRTRLGAAAFCVALFEDAIRGEIRIDETDRRANMLFIDDAASACVKSLCASGPLSDVYNIAGFECSVGDLVKTIQTYTSVHKVYSTSGGNSPWPTDISSDRARREIGYLPGYDIEQACRAYLQYLQDTRQPTR